MDQRARREMNQEELLELLEENNLEARKFGQAFDVRRFGHRPVSYVLFEDDVMLVSISKHYVIYQNNAHTFNELLWPTNNRGFMSLSNPVEKTDCKKEIRNVDDTIAALRRMLA